MTGDWKLIWDDQVDGVMSESHHQCHLRFKQINNTIGGDFVGPVAGRERDALIQGKVVATGSNQLLVFQQHEQGYTCSYQIDLGSGIGTWVDTQGRTGDFQLLKYQ